MAEEQKTNPAYNFFIKLITTFFFVGYLPLIPGTFGSVAGLFIFIFLRNSLYLVITALLLIMVFGFLLAGKAAKLFKRRDPPQIVIDELAGMLISFLGVPVDNKLTLVVGFIIFRILDAIKPYPANRFHHRTGSLGIMGDDLVAGIYANLTLRLALIFLMV